MRILAIDPGKTTGWVIIQGRELLKSEEYDWEQVVHALVDLRGIDLVVCERFIINVKTARNSQAPWSLEVQGHTRAVCLLDNRKFELQSATDAKNFTSNEKLREIGWWHVGGDGHANDAARHARLAVARHTPGDLW